MTRYVFDKNNGYDPEITSRGASIWRYMDLPKFLWLLDKQSLFLSRLDRFDDKFEGSAPLSLIKARQARQSRELVITLRADSPDVIKTHRRNTAVNCWHMSEGESSAMWKLYSINNFGVAIRSTIQGLAESLPPFRGEDVERQRDLPDPEVLSLDIRLVHYINFSAEEKVLPKPRDLHLYKRASFEFEKELRLIAQAFPYQGDPTDYSVFPNNGDWVPVELATLIREVYVAPAAPGWYVDLIALALKRHNIDIPITHSDLDRDPVF
jgi:hypothetical protein